MTQEQSVFIQLRKLATGEKVWEAEAKGVGSADGMAFSRDGKQLVAAVNGQALRVCDRGQAADQQGVGLPHRSATCTSRLRPTASG